MIELGIAVVIQADVDAHVGVGDVAQVDVHVATGADLVAAATNV